MNMLFNFKCLIDECTSSTEPLQFATYLEISIYINT